MQFSYTNTVRLAGQIVSVVPVITEGYADPILKVTLATRQVRGDRAFEQHPTVTIFRADEELKSKLRNNLSGGDYITLDAYVKTNARRDGGSFNDLTAYNSSITVLPKELFTEAPAAAAVPAEAAAF